jgi:hypothetical protein
MEHVKKKAKQHFGRQPNSKRENNIKIKLEETDYVGTTLMSLKRKSKGGLLLWRTSAVPQYWHKT